MSTDPKTGAQKASKETAARGEEEQSQEIASAFPLYRDRNKTRDGMTRQDYMAYRVEPLTMGLPPCQLSRSICPDNRHGGKDGFLAEG